LVGATLWAGQFQIADVKLFGASEALLAARTPFHFEPESFEGGAARQNVEREVESILIHIRQLANAHADGRDVRAWVPARLGGNAFENRRGNSNFVHSAPQQILGN
jgi:hypothetical protein